MRPTHHVTQRLLGLQPGKIDLNLDRVRAASVSLGSPHQACRWIVVGGTNGKGSTARFLESLLLAAGKRVGLYTSPHLEHVAERVRVNGQELALDTFESVASIVLEWLDSGAGKLTYFEAVTLTALLAFADSGVEFGILEVGLGGRLDATNMVEPSLTLLTNIGLDHTEWLGDTVEEIAWEKGGITRPGTPLITGLSPHLLEAALRDRQAPSSIHRLGEDFEGAVTARGFTYRDDSMALDSAPLGLAGAHQGDNASLAVRAALLLAPELDGTQVAAALATTTHPGRMETLRAAPLVLLDGAHNREGAEALAKHLEGLQLPQKPTVIVGVKEPRDPRTLVEPL